MNSLSGLTNFATKKCSCQLYPEAVIVTPKHIPWTIETGCSPAGNGLWVINIFTWGCDSLVREPSTPANELPVWYTHPSGWDCCGATWYWNNSNSLIRFLFHHTSPHGELTQRRVLSVCMLPSTVQLWLGSNSILKYIYWNIKHQALVIVPDRFGSSIVKNCFLFFIVSTENPQTSCSSELY